MNHACTIHGLFLPFFLLHISYFYIPCLEYIPLFPISWLGDILFPCLVFRCLLSCFPVSPPPRIKGAQRITPSSPSPGESMMDRLARTQPLRNIFLEIHFCMQVFIRSFFNYLSPSLLVIDHLAGTQATFLVGAIVNSHVLT